MPTFRRTSFLAVLTACLTAGCDGMGPKTIISYWVPGRELPLGAKTFDWAPAERRELADSGTGYPEMDSLIRASIQRGFVAKGYTLELEGEPDFWVRYRLGRDVRQAGTGTGSWDQGALAIDVFDPVKSHQIWCGTLQARLDFSAPPDVRRQRLEKVVKYILKEFPTQGKGQD